MSTDFLPPPSEKSKDKDKIPTVTLYNIITDWVNHKNDELPGELRNFPIKKTFRAIKQDMAEDMPTVLEQYKDKQDKPIVRFSSIKSVSMEAWKQLKNFENTEYYQLCMTAQQIEKALTHWAIVSTTNGGLPPAMVGYDDDRPAFYRLQYKPVEDVADIAFQAPTWLEILERTTNAKALCMRIASIFDEHADRKQAIYMSGPKDCGKSQIEAILSHISGGDAPSGGGFTALTPDQTKSPHWLEPVVGKRVVCMSEAASGFLESNKFKSLTGDLRHMVNPKGKAIINRALPVLLFMFANEPPEISSKGELFERIIDCRITPPKLDGRGLIPDHEYQQKLKDELPAFLGYCNKLYEPYRNRRLPCKKGTLEESSSDHESYATDFLLAFWELDPNGSVNAETVGERLRFSGIRDTKAQAAIHKIWERRHNIKKGRSNRGNVFRGMRKLTPQEATDRAIDIPI